MIAFMFVPVLHINRDEISVQENRTLAKYVPLIDDDSGAINYNFGKDFESWFNDRFFGRKQFIKTSKKIDMYINNEIKNFDAMAGKENWLFTKRWNSEDMFRNKYLFDDEDLSKLKHRLESLQMWLSKRDIKLYLMLVPDKERVYGEYYPTDIRRSTNRPKSNRFTSLSENIRTFRSFIRLRHWKKPKRIMFCFTKPVRTGTIAAPMSPIWK